MNVLSFIKSDLERLKSELLSSHLESCAIVLFEIVGRRFIATDLFIAPVSAYLRRNTSRAVLDPTFFAPLVAKAAKRGLGVAFVHTHPRDDLKPRFSSEDDRGERLLSDFVLSRGVTSSIAIVVSPGGMTARHLARLDEIEIVSLGEERVVVAEVADHIVENDSSERQVRLLGRRGQRRIETLVVGIVGLGGTGSIVSQELAHLGVSRFVLVDPDRVEVTNLNRLVTANESDVGRFKTDAAADRIRGVRRAANVETVVADVLEPGVAEHLLDCDVIFSCTDSHGSRALLNQIAYQYLIPVFDMGVGITTADGGVRHVRGRCQVLTPHLACLVCQETLDSKQVRSDFLNEVQRTADPYFVGPGEPQPAVISLNATVASLAITMFLAVVTGLPSRARSLLYDALAASVRAVKSTQTPTCIVCSPRGALGKAKQWQLPSRTR